MTGFNPRWVAGKTIERVDLNRFPTGRGRELTSSPIIRFTDGSFVYFTVQETEGSEYGIEITYRKGGN